MVTNIYKMSNEKILKTLRDDFNKESLKLIKVIQENIKIPLSEIYIDGIHKKIKKDSSFMINTFVLNALEYEDQIMDGDDNYFTKKCDNKNDFLKFKIIWEKLGTKTKNIIKQSMKLLCIIARKYFNIQFN